MPTQLMPGERSIALVRQHWSVLAGHVLGAIVVIVVAIVLNAVLPAHIGSLSITTIKTVIVLVLVIAAVLWAGVRVLRWRFATYHLTDRRIVMEGGILSRTAETIPLDRIQNTGADKKYIAWQPTGGPSYHVPEAFGRLRMVK